MKIPTANVIISYDKETMNRLFSAGATYSNLVAKLSEGNEDALFFNSTSNPNFISFEHSFGHGGGEKMQLTLIDPGQDFEKRFLNNNAFEVINRYADKQAQTTKSSNGYNTDQVTNSIKDMTDGEVTQLKNDLDSTLGTKEIFVAYGSGENLDLWAGPFRTKLGSTDVNFKASKKVTLNLIPTISPLDLTHRRGAFNEQVNINLLGLKAKTEGRSEDIDFSSDTGYEVATKLKSKYSEFDTQEKELKDIEYEDVASKIKKLDFHAIVIDTLRNYIQNATNNRNVIVLLPNINITCRQAIREVALKYSLDVEQETPLVVKSQPSFNLGSFKRSRSDDLYSPSLNAQAKEHLFVESVLKSFGLTMQPNVTPSPPYLTTQAKSDVIRSFSSGAVPTSIEVAPTAEEAFSNFLTKKTYYGCLEKTDKTIPNHVKVVSDVIGNIRKMSKDSYPISTPMYITETNTKILKSWGSEKNKDSYVFAGYDTFLEDREAIIVGDSALISEYLYGDVDLKNKKQRVRESKNKARKSLSASASTEAYLDASLEMPLHPLDKASLANENYNKNIREICYPEIAGAGSFGDISDIPDDFGYKDADFNKKQKDYIRQKGFPVFRYNTQNPNVISLDAKFGDIYLMSLNLGYSKEISRISSAVAEGVLPTGIGDFSIRSKGAAIAYLRAQRKSQGMGSSSKLELLNSLAERMSPELVEELGLGNPAAAAMSIVALLDASEKNLKTVVKMDQQLPGDPTTVMSDLTENLYRKANSVSITTLPTFHISKAARLSSKCLLFAQDSPITQTIRPARGAINTFLSGIYRIVGFKHTISTSKAESTFKLSKEMTSAGVKS